MRGRLIRPSDRLNGLFDTEGNLVWAVRTPPGHAEAQFSDPLDTVAW